MMCAGNVSKTPRNEISRRENGAMPVAVDESDSMRGDDTRCIDNER